MFKIALCNCSQSRTVIENAVAKFLGNLEFVIQEFEDVDYRQTDITANNGEFSLWIINQNKMAKFMESTMNNNDPSNESNIDFATQMSFVTFVTDPISDMGITNMLNLLHNYRKLASMYLSVSFLTDKGMQSIDVAQILYFEFLERKIKIKTQGSQYMCSDTLHNVLSLVEKHDFHPPHKSFIVNFKHITQIKNYNITLSDGSNIPLSQKKSKEFRRLYKQYIAAPL